MESLDQLLNTLLKLLPVVILGIYLGKQEKRIEHLEKKMDHLDRKKKS